jgi:hypothetical protein
MIIGAQSKLGTGAGSSAASWPVRELERWAEDHAETGIARTTRLNVSERKQAKVRLVG